MSNILSEVHPELIAEWSDKNLPLTPDRITYGSKLYEMTESEDCPFVLWIGSRRMIKRKAFDEYIERQYSI